MKGVAGAALVTAVEEEVSLPVEYVRAAWRWVKATTPMFFNVEVFGEFDDEVVRADAVELFVAASSGKNERRLATHVLSGSAHALHLDDNILMRLVESCRTGAAALDAAGVLIEVQKARGIQPDVLRAIRNRWISGTAGHKEAAILLAVQCLDRDLAWTAAVLGDPDPDVRAALVYQLARDAQPGDVVLDLFHARLTNEASPDVRAALHRAIAAVEAVEGDVERERRRRRERSAEHMATALARAPADAVADR